MSTSKKATTWPPPKPAAIKAFEHSREIRDILNTWYTQHIEPLGPGVEVTGFKESDGTIKYGDYHSSSDTHSAILIGITEIHEPTAEDVLQQLITSLDSDDYDPDDYDAVLSKARAYLAKKRGE
jgi:hypothetical protein